MVRLRLKRLGKRHRPFYRICAFDSHCRRDGEAIEELGYYDPMASNENQQVSLNRERIIHWLDVGAQPTETVGQILRKNGIHPQVGRKKS